MIYNDYNAYYAHVSLFEGVIVLYVVSGNTNFYSCIFSFYAKNSYQCPI